MLERGAYELGSVEEMIAIYAKQKLNRIKRLEVSLTTKASLIVANAIINPAEVKFDDINSLLQRYSELVFPELVVERDEAAEKIKNLIKKESKYVFRVSKVPTKGDDQRLRRRNLRGK